MSKRIFGTEQVEIKHEETGDTTHVVRSAFENVWSKRGWTLVEDEGSKEAGQDGVPEPVAPEATAKLTALKTNAQKKEQG